MNRTLVRNGLTALLVCSVALPLLRSAADARPAYRNQATTQFHFAKDKVPYQIACTYCHQNPQGGKGWNTFGESLRSTLGGEAKGVIADALYLTLAMMKDSDGDGYEDALEVFGRTLPGSAESKPKVPKATLKARFNRAGGLKLYEVVKPATPPAS